MRRPSLTRRVLEGLELAIELAHADLFGEKDRCHDLEQIEHARNWVRGMFAYRGYPVQPRKEEENSRQFCLF
jgi:hypothetical protein